MIAAHIRIYSNNKVSFRRQEEIIKSFAQSKELTIDKWYKDTGNKIRTNNQIENIIKALKAGDTLIIADISRLSRKLVGVMHLLTMCIERKITLYSAMEGYTFQDDINSKTFAFTFCLVAEIERKLISVRTKEALALTRSKGVKLGRPSGSQQIKLLLPHKEEIEQEIKDENVTYSELAEHYKVSPSSMKRFIKEYITDIN
ncbi:recombinase family protein [Parabacteroides bouchesdurhonensis]|uniref:recombinase family protein n=1 Tax=Parabacteroides bouchesdurhonensis TaxID=1936995 RepID=UPI000E49963D|nr:recombinase family protein [Parabacteroides bouchesdurhonensis]RHJ95166.1 serine recombinase [Bacteroides sp. AM07-16]